MPKQTVKNRKNSFGYMLLRGAFIHNPVLVHLLGLAPIVAVSKSLRAAFWLSVVFSVTLFITQMLACRFMKKLQRYIRISLYLLIGLAVVLPLGYLLDLYLHAATASLGIYLPLLAVNSVTALHCEKLAVQSSPKMAAYDAIATGIGYSAVFMLVGFLRELIGNGSILGRPVSVPTLSAFSLPFGSFFILAFLAAGLQWFTKRYFPAHSKDTGLKISDTVVRLRAQPKAQPTKATLAQEAQDPIPDIDIGPLGAQDIDLPEPERGFQVTPQPESSYEMDFHARYQKLMEKMGESLERPEE